MRGIHSSRRIKSWRRRKGLNNYWLIQIHNCSQPILQTRYLLYLHVQYILIPPLQAQSSNNDIYWRIGPGHGEADADTLHSQIPEAECRWAHFLKSLRVSMFFTIKLPLLYYLEADFFFHVLLGTSRWSLFWILAFHLRVEVPFLQKNCCELVTTGRLNPSDRLEEPESWSALCLGVVRPLHAQRERDPSGRGPSAHISREHWARHRSSAFTVGERRRDGRRSNGEGTWGGAAFWGKGWRLREGGGASRHGWNTLDTS